MSGLEVTSAMIDAGAAVVREWFPYDGERPAISEAEAQLLAKAILEKALGLVLSGEGIRDAMRGLISDLSLYIASQHTAAAPQTTAQDGSQQ